MNRAIIVNADDLGLTPSINDGIFEAMDAGAVSDASLIASGEGFEHAVHGLMARGRRTIGLHFCVVDKEIPLVTSPEISIILEDGHFLVNRNKLFARFIFLKRKTILKVLGMELDAQINKILSTGLAITHFDSHQHTHLFPGISSLVAKACQQYNIPFIRIPATRLSSPIAMVVEALSLRLKIIARMRGIVSVPSLGFETSGQATAESLQKDLCRVPKYKLAELMFHPGHANNSTSEKYAHWGYNWDRELEVLMQAKIYISKMGIRSVSYKVAQIERLYELL